MTADERIQELIARAGSPVMICKGEEKYSASARLDQIDKRARQMAYELLIPKYDCTISIMRDEIVKQDGKITDMANTIDRMEAALYNVLNERDQLMADLRHEIRKHGSCDFCQNVPFHAADCNGCTMDNDRWTWRGVPDKED